MKSELSTQRSHGLPIVSDYMLENKPRELKTKAILLEMCGSAAGQPQSGLNVFLQALATEESR